MGGAGGEASSFKEAKLSENVWEWDDVLGVGSTISISGSSLTIRAMLALIVAGGELGVASASM